MCSRYTVGVAPAALAERFGAPPPPGARARWNAAPGQELPAVIAAPAPRFALMRFGLLPSWAKDGKPQINARADTAADKPYFRDAFRWRRCLIPADGWYEWPKKGADKAPRLFRPKAGGLFAFAGLWEPGGFAVLTTEPNPLVAAVHDRMPAVLPRDAEAEWLSPKTAPERLKELLRPFPSAALEAVRVSERVGAVDADDRSLIVPSLPAQGELF